MGRFSYLLIFLVFASPLMGQVPYPDHCIEDVNWSSGIHNTSITNGITSPCSASQSVSISGTAEAEFVSATQVRLTDGFHAGGFTGDGHFRAMIDGGLGQPADLVIISPDPATHIIDNVVHVEKWEKFEIGLRLPQEYQDAIDRFFDNYYTNGPLAYATPGNVDPIHDLNPYADDSLQLVMVLTKPNGQQLFKWGFFMREAEFEDVTHPLAFLVEATNDPLHPYNIRFRFAPEMEGEWNFSLSIKAPYTSNLANTSLSELFYSNFSFVCDPPLNDNRGFLGVHPENHHILRFDYYGQPFIGLGVNMADMPQVFPGAIGLGYGPQYQLRDHAIMQTTMDDLREMGGNFMRMFLMDNIFSPEYVNLGVYDQYKSAPFCNNGSGASLSGNCQYQAWAFDQMLNSARNSQIYIQLCVDPYPPVVFREKGGWGANPYLLNFVKPYPDQLTGRYDMNNFFYSTDAQTGERLYDSGVFYYWKRKYKYVLSRWGYSVNIASLEFFNEIDQMLSYQTSTISDNCPENNGTWQMDTELPLVLQDWITDMADYVRGDVITSNLPASPLGEDKRLFLMSYTDARPATDASHYLPFTNPSVDLIDVHRAYWPDYLVDQGTPSKAMSDIFEHAEGFRQYFPTTNAVDPRKPFNHGEFQSYTLLGWTREMEKIFHNYDVSFHNEIWSSVFSGKFATGTSWHWERVFWWEHTLPKPPAQTIAQNPFQQVFSNALAQPCTLNVNGVPVVINNRRIHHNFRPLANLLNHPGWLAYEFFNSNYTAERFFDSDLTNPNVLEAYYLRDVYPGFGSTMAIGWVHNRNAWTMNNFYFTGSIQNFLGCNPPNAQSQTITLSGFEPDTEYFITWFPTRLNSTVYPADMQLFSDGSGSLIVDLTNEFGGTVNDYLDTLRSDYAFIVSLQPIFKSLTIPVSEVPPVKSDWDFSLYPNPARDELFVRLPDDAPKDILLYDLAGRRIQNWSSVTSTIQRLSIAHLAKGAYHVRVSDGTNAKTKKLIIH